MSNEEANKDFHWKNKLDELESLPGESFNKQAAWAQLHERLQGKSRNKKAVWYWVAAACLLLTLMLPWLFSVNKKHSDLVKSEASKKQAESPVTPMVALPNKSIPATISAPVGAKKVTDQFVVIHHKVDRSAYRKEPASQSISAKIQKEGVAPGIHDQSVIPVDKTPVVVLNLPEKKKLPVVHINDMEDPEPAIIARSYERRSFQVKFINRQLEKNPPSSGNTGFNIFKATPPSN